MDDVDLNLQGQFVLFLCSHCDVSIVCFQHEYMSYMEKKTSKRQTAIISLSDQNHKEIQDIKDQKQEMLDEYESKKAGRILFVWDGYLFLKFIAQVRINMSVVSRGSSLAHLSPLSEIHAISG